MSVSPSPLEKSYHTQAVCSIKHGDECKISFPADHDTESSVAHNQYKRLQGENAVVVGLNEHSVVIEVKTGLCAKEIIHSFNPMNLVFSGTFQKATAKPEEPHF